MAQDVTQDEVECRILELMFDLANSPNGAANLTGLTELSKLPGSRVKMAVEALKLRGLVHSSQPYMSSIEYTISEKGYRSVEESRLASDSNSNMPIPASNRIVNLGHNSSEYLAIETQIEELTEAIRTSNQVGDDDNHRDQLLKSLSAASQLWASTQLKVVQIKVGVIMAVDDACAALNKCGKATAFALIVDMIKSFVKNTTGIEI